MKKFIYVTLIILFIGGIFLANYFLNNNNINKIAIENTSSTNNSLITNNNSISNSETENKIENTINSENIIKNPVEESVEKPITNQVIEVNSSTFESEVLKSSKPVLIDFYATWCGPCRYLSPILAEIANEMPNLKVVKIDVDKEEKLSYQYRAFSLPTVILIKDGKEVTRFAGAAPKNEIIKYLNNYL